MGEFGDASRGYLCPLSFLRSHLDWNKFVSFNLFRISLRSIREGSEERGISADRGGTVGLQPEMSLMREVKVAPAPGKGWGQGETSPSVFCY